MHDFPSHLPPWLATVAVIAAIYALIRWGPIVCTGYALWYACASDRTAAGLAIGLAFFFQLLAAATRTKRDHPSGLFRDFESRSVLFYPFRSLFGIASNPKKPFVSTARAWRNW